jgi:hypothetical protein
VSALDELRGKYTAPPGPKTARYVIEESDFERDPVTGHYGYFTKLMWYSKQGELVIAEYLRDQGEFVVAPENDIADHYDRRRLYRDSGDLFANEQRCEVKRSGEFTAVKYSYPDAFLVKCKLFDGYDPPCDRVYLISHSLNAAALVDVRETRAFWGKRRAAGSGAGQMADVYTADKWHLQLFDVRAQRDRLVADGVIEAPAPYFQWNEYQAELKAGLKARGL